MGYATQARPYAYAAYDVAKKNNAVESWWQCLLALQEALSVEKLKKYIANPTISLDEKINTLIDVCRDWLNDDIKRLIRLLGENSRLLAIDDICSIFRERMEEANNIVHASVTTAFELDQAQQSSLVSAISKKTGLDMEPEFTVDPEIIGGAIIRFDGNVIDISVRKQLAQLKQNLIR